MRTLIHYLKKIIGQIQRLPYEFPVGIVIPKLASFEVGVIYPYAWKQAISFVNEMLARYKTGLEWPRDKTELLTILGGRIQFVLDDLSAHFAELNPKNARLSGRIIGWEYLTDQYFGDEITKFVKESKDLTLDEFLLKFEREYKMPIEFSYTPERLKAMAKDDLGLIIRSIKRLRKVPTLAAIIRAKLLGIVNSIANY